VNGADNKTASARLVTSLVEQVILNSGSVKAYRCRLASAGVNALGIRTLSKQVLGLGNGFARCRNELFAVRNSVAEALYVLPNATCLRVIYVSSQISYLKTDRKFNAGGSLTVAPNWTFFVHAAFKLWAAS
jgi:hypothetical protein